MKGKEKMSLIAAVMIMLAVLTVFAGCVVDEQPPEPQGYTVTLWEGNSYALAADAVDTLFDSIPSREGYLFGGWFFDNGTWQKPVTAAGLAASEAGTIIYAKWTATGDLALVTFYDHRDGVVLYRAYVEKGSDLSSFDISPTFRPADEKFEYIFKGWDKDLTAIAGDTDVRPVYDEIARTYNVTFIVNNVAAKVVSVPYGGAVEAPDAEDISTYLPHINGKKVTFSGWSATAEELSSITEDTEVVALWSTEDIYFEVTFNYGDGQTTTQTVRYGEDAVPPTYGLDKPDDLGVDHVFVGWDNNHCFVTEDRVINAVYDDHTAWYRVDFYVDNVVYCRYYVEGGEASPMPADPVKPSDETNNYTFDKWLDSRGREADLGSITSDTAVYAHFGTQKRTYTVEFYVEGKLVDNQNVTTGAAAVAPGEDKVQAAISSEEGVVKTFKGWDRTYGEVKSDLVVNAVIERTLETRTVTFKWWGLEGEESEEMTVTFGTAAVAPEVENTTIEKEDGIYVFDGWEVVTQGYDSWTSVKSDLTVEAQYKKYPKVFEVRFLDAEGALIGDVQMVEYGGSAVAPEQTPQKAADAQYTYEFDRWDEDFTNVTSDLTISPLYNAITRTYTVTFYDADGAQIGEKQSVPYGGKATKPESPVKESTEKYSYTFAGWTGGDVGNIVGDTEFYPTYTETVRKYNVTFVYGKVDEPESSDYHEVIQQVEYGASATAPENEAKAYKGTNTTEYQFAGWETSNYLNVTGDLTVKAIYRTYDNYFNVTFRDESGALLSAPQYVRYGKDEVVLPDAENIVKQQDVQYTYAFDGWTYDDGEFISDEDFAAIAGGKTVDRDYELTAHFAATLRKYTVIFYDDDRTTVLSEQQVEYGTSAAEPEAPTKEQTVQWVYEFSGWSSEAWKNITGDTVVYATYSQSLRKYDVTFVYGNVDDESSGDYRKTTIQVEYGKIPTVPEDIDTARPSTAKYDYTFNGWNGLLAVNGDMTVIADYVATIRNYKVTFYNMTTGASEGENDMPYGSWIERTMSAGGYVFDSWYTKDGDNYVALPTKDDVLSAGGEGHVTGDMTLYGNLVMEGITFDSNNNISGYTGSNSFVVIPTYANRQKVEEINSYMFRGRTQEEIEAVYLPKGVVVNTNAFRSMDGTGLFGTTVQDADVAKTIILYVEDSNPGVIITGNFKYNWDSGIDGDNKYFDVKGIETIGDYNYVLLADNTAIIQRFVNGTKKYVELPTGTVHVSSGDNIGDYRITELAGAAFRGMSNVETVFIANEWKDLKFGKHIFSGLTATIYIAISDEGKVGNVPAIQWGGIEGAQVVTKWASWNISWAGKASGDEGELTLEWNCDGLYTQDEVTYLLRSNGEAIAISQEFTFFGGLTKLTVPETLTVNEKTYTVTEIGDQLFKDERLLTDVSIPGTIKRIGEQAFYGTNLKSLTLAEGLEEIGNLAFAMNGNLSYVYIPESCDTIGYFAFAGANNAELFMGRKSAPTGSGLIGYKVGWNTTVDLTGIDISSIGNIVSSLVGSGTTLPTYWNAVGKTEVDISGTGWEIGYQVRLIFVVTKDGNARVIGATTAGANIGLKLKSFNIPSTVTYNDVVYTVTSIDSSAFADWELDTLGIPSTVTSIASNAFSSIKTINTDAAQPTEGTKPAGWEFDATNITINYGQTLS